MWTRKTILSNAINDWQARSLITDQTASDLLADTDARTSGFSFQNILILLAVICLGFAAMTFVAANWDNMARLTRVGIVFGAMWAFWSGSAFFKIRGQSWFAQVFTLGACAMFGAGIMLISQIYHIQGSAKDATWLWAMGTLLAAGLTRSITALALTIALFTIWAWLEPSMVSWRTPEYQFSFIIYMVICTGLAYWMHSRLCAHLIAFATAAWAVPTAMAFADDGALFFPTGLISLSFVLLSAMLFSDRKYDWLRGFERAVIFYLIGVLGLMCFFWSVEVTGSDLQEFRNIPALVPSGISLIIPIGFGVAAYFQSHTNRYDIIVTAIFAQLTSVCMFVFAGEEYASMALLLAASVWIIRMGWRIEYRPIAVLGFISFGLMMLWIYFETIGTLLGTSVFYAVAGVLLLAGVFIIPRLTRTKGEPS